MSDSSSSILVRRVRAKTEVMERFVEECWMPFWRDLGEAVGEQLLSTEFDREELVESFVDSYDVSDRRCWVTLDEVDEPTAGLDEIDAVFAGWINAGIEPTDPFLDPPDRLYIGNLYVRPAYRGSGLADQLVARAVQYAQEEGCVELTLDVERDNERALAYYEKLGFEAARYSMSASLSSFDALAFEEI